MKTAIIVAVLAGLMGAPIACAIVACPAMEKHDCCPKPKSFAACPFDILSSAKAALDVAAVPVTLDRPEVSIEPVTRVPILFSTFDGSGIYLVNRVLRI